MGVRYYQGHGAYRRDVEIPAALLDAVERTWALESEGFYGLGDVWLNGKRIAKVDGQYLGFRLELPGGALRAGRNTIGLRLDNRYHRNVLPGTACRTSSSTAGWQDGSSSWATPGSGWSR